MPPHAGAVEAVSKVVYEHAFDVTGGKGLGPYRTKYHCDCGEPLITDDHKPGRPGIYTLHAAHVATVAVAAATPLLAARALLDAADLLTARATTLTPNGS